MYHDQLEKTVDGVMQEVVGGEQSHMSRVTWTMLSKLRN